MNDVTCRWIPLLVLATFLSLHARAQLPEEVEQRLAVRAGVAHTDNLGREPTTLPTERTTFATVGVDIGAERQTHRFRGFIDGSLDYHRYESGRYSNETLGSLSGELDVGIVPERFAWVFSNQLGHVRRDPIHAAGPGNRERLNLFSTGPRAVFPLAERNRLVLTGEYADRRWQESSELDGASTAADLSWLRAVSPGRVLGVTAAARRIAYDLGELASHDVQSAFFTYGGRFSASLLELRAGVNRLRFEDRSRTKPYFSATLRRELTPRSRLSVEAVTRFEDSTAQLGDGPVLREALRGTGAALRDVGGDLGHVPRTSNPLDRQRLRVSYALLRSRAVVSIGTQWSRERFEGVQGLDRDGVNTGAGVDYRFGPRLRGHFDAYHTSEKFTDTGHRARERGAAAGVSRQLSRTLAMTVRYQHYDRHDDQRDDLDESRFTLWVVWVPF